LRVHVQPRSSKNRCCGLHGGYLKIAITAPPIEGKANKALISYLAELFGVSRKSIGLVSGEYSRTKIFHFKTVSEKFLADRVDTLLS